MNESMLHILQLLQELKLTRMVIEPHNSGMAISIYRGNIVYAHYLHTIVLQSVNIDSFAVVLQQAAKFINSVEKELKANENRTADKRSANKSNK